MRSTQVQFLFVFCLFVGIGLQTNVKDEVLNTPITSIPPDFFGMHIHGMVVPRDGTDKPDPWPPVSFGTWRLWDAYVDWPHLEPQAENWNFRTLDKYVELAEQHQVEVLLPLGMSPTWASLRPGEKSSSSLGSAAPPKSLDSWKTYVRTVATRYKGRVHYYEIWNEPNLKDFFSGTPKELGLLVREASTVLKQVDPTIKVVSPSITAEYGIDWFDQFLSEIGHKDIDVVGYHFYVTPKPPEAMLPIVRKVRAVLRRHGLGDIPVWNTETGWRIANHNTEVKPEGSGFSSRVLSDDEASSYVARSYVLLWAAGVSRFYWYAWDNGVMGLTEADGRTIKAPAIAYTQVENWLVGARMTSCASDKSDTWICAITRDPGYKGWIIWNSNHSIDYQVPKSWGVRRVRLLDSRSQNIPDSSVIEAGPLPLLLENKSK